MDRFAIVISTRWASSPRDIFLLAIITSKLTTIFTDPPPQIVRSWSSFSSAAWRNRADITRNSSPPIRKMGMNRVL